jgi:dethiobiotin synthetase
VARWLITGIGTDVGKTWVSEALIRGWVGAGRKVGVLKPVLTGVDLADPASWATSDPGRLLLAAGRSLNAEVLGATCPFHFRAPLSPDQAAEQEGRVLSLSEVLQVVLQADRPEFHELLVEGAGGVMSPLSADATQLELWRRLGWPAVVVAGTYLGSLSHTLSALEVLGSQAAGVILSPSNDAPVSPERHAASLSRYTAVPIAHCARGQTELPPSLLDGWSARLNVRS